MVAELNNGYLITSRPPSLLPSSPPLTSPLRLLQHSRKYFPGSYTEGRFLLSDRNGILQIVSLSLTCAPTEF